ncbi:hypothetical protein [Wenyingzhuangia sp. IMCC45574]
MIKLRVSVAMLFLATLFVSCNNNSTETIEEEIVFLPTPDEVPSAIDENNAILYDLSTTELGIGYNLEKKEEKGNPLDMSTISIIPQSSITSYYDLDFFGLDFEEAIARKTSSVITIEADRDFLNHKKIEKSYRDFLLQFFNSEDSKIYLLREAHLELKHHAIVGVPKFKQEVVNIIEEKGIGEFDKIYGRYFVGSNISGANMSIIYVYDFSNVLDLNKNKIESIIKKHVLGEELTEFEKNVFSKLEVNYDYHTNLPDYSISLTGNVKELDDEISKFVEYASSNSDKLPSVGFSLRSYEDIVYNYRDFLSKFRLYYNVCLSHLEEWTDILTELKAVIPLVKDGVLLDELHMAKSNVEAKIKDARSCTNSRPPSLVFYNDLIERAKKSLD